LSIIIWLTSDFTIIKQLKIQDGCFSSITFGQNNQLAAGDSNGDVSLFDESFNKIIT